MSQQKQAPLPRQEFQEWLENAAVPVLVLQKGKHLGSVVKVPATPEIDYLFGCETFYGERISWSDRLEFCGLYDRQHQALHLLDDPLPNFVSGLTEEDARILRRLGSASLRRSTAMLRRPFPMSEVASLSGNSPVRGTSIHTGITREPRQGGRQLPSFFLGRNPMYSFTVSIIHP